jgi:hypothetical protein
MKNRLILLMMLGVFLGGNAFAEESVPERVGDGIKKGGEAAGKGIEKGAEAAGRGIKKGAEATVKGVKKAGKWVGEKMQKGGEKMQEVSKPETSKSGVSKSE